MNTFTLKLHDATREESITDVTSFVGEDSSGSFGLLAGHARMMSILSTGLARYCTRDGQWHYIAVPGAVLYFHDDCLTLCTRRYLVDTDYQRISEALEQQLLAEEEQLRATRESLHRMEEEVFKRLWEMGRAGLGQLS